MDDMHESSLEALASGSLHCYNKVGVHVTSERQSQCAELCAGRTARALEGERNSRRIYICTSWDRWWRRDCMVVQGSMTLRFVDLDKAFDTVLREMVMAILRWIAWIAPSRRRTLLSDAWKSTTCIINKKSTWLWVVPSCRRAVRACGTSLVRWMALQCAKRTARRLASTLQSHFCIRQIRKESVGGTTIQQRRHVEGLRGCTWCSPPYLRETTLAFTLYSRNPRELGSILDTNV